MNVALWIVAGLLAAVFLPAGSTKLSVARERLGELSSGSCRNRGLPLSYESSRSLMHVPSWDRWHGRCPRPGSLQRRPDEEEGPS